jgi:hypothetical protein
MFAFSLRGRNRLRSRATAGIAASEAVVRRPQASTRPPLSPFRLSRNDASTGATVSENSREPIMAMEIV